MVQGWQLGAAPPYPRGHFRLWCSAVPNSQPLRHHPQAAGAGVRVTTSRSSPSYGGPCRGLAGRGCLLIDEVRMLRAVRCIMLDLRAAHGRRSVR